MSTENPAIFILGEAPMDGQGNIANGHRIALSPLALKFLVFIAQAQAPVHEQEILETGRQHGASEEDILPSVGELMMLGLVRDASKIGHWR